VIIDPLSLTQQGIVFSFIIVRVALGVTSETVNTTDAGRLSLFAAKGAASADRKSSFYCRSTARSATGTGDNGHTLKINVSTANHTLTQTSDCNDGYELKKLETGPQLMSEMLVHGGRGMYDV
jgi:hypothetical protein